MNTSQLIRICSVVAVIVIALLIWLFLKRPKISHEQSAPSVTMTNAVEIMNPPASELRAGDQTNSSATTTNVPSEYSDEARLDMAEGMNAPINFYGRMVDQDDQAIAGVNIKMTIRRWIISPNKSVGTFPVAGEFEEYDVMSDANGYFHIIGKHGDNLALKSIEKAGYELSARQHRSLGAPSGNPADPVIIRMWKKGQAEPLIVHGKSFDAAPDGRTNLVSLMTGIKTESAKVDGQSIAISIERSANGSDTGKYDWSVRIQMAGGGLLESEDEFMYRAPMSGYKPNLVFQFKKDAPEWSPVMKKRFYLKTPQAMHGHIELEVYPINLGGKTTFRLKSAINPSGSRNLEYDEAVQPKPTVYE